MRTDVKDLYERRALTLIAGPCVIESEDLCLEIARRVEQLCQQHGLRFIFKASFDKANRTSLSSFRGPGLESGLRILARVREEVGVPVLTDVHEASQVDRAAEVVDVLQIPAFLCRQTDLIAATAHSGLPTNIKKGQFLAPEDMQHVADKYRQSGGKSLAVTERGSTFGYHNLVVDMRSLPAMRTATDAAVVFDATHSVQRPSDSDGITGGDRTLAPLLARAATAVGIDGLFCEVHPDPDHALSDGPNSLTFELLERVLVEVSAIDEVVRRVGAV